MNPHHHLHASLYLMVGHYSRSSSSSSSRRTTTTTSSSSSRILLLLTLLPLTLASFAFLLQWRGGVIDQPITFHDMDSSPAVFSGSLPSHLRRSSHSNFTTRLLSHNNNNPSLPYYHRHWKLDFSSSLKPKICITTTTLAGLEQTLPWIFYHKVIGVSSFILFVEGNAASPNVSTVLQSIPGVQVIPRTRELEEQQKSLLWNSTGFEKYMNKPCNYELFLKQSLNMEMAIVMARESGMDWIVHVDTDELIHPAGTQEYSLRELLANVPGNVDMVVFPNYESIVERDDIKEPFSEVSMFKKNYYDHLPNKVFYRNYEEASRGYPEYFLTYGNGKSAARIQDHLQTAGAHRWYNYRKTPIEIKLKEAAVLHYTYAKFSDLTSRRDRCSCKPTKKAVRRCFMLRFDREAFLIASTATEEEMLQWYRERVVWTDKRLILKLLRKGIFTRIYAPMVIVQSFREPGVFRNIITKAAETTLS